MQASIFKRLVTSVRAVRRHMLRRQAIVDELLEHIRATHVQLAAAGNVGGQRGRRGGRTVDHAIEAVGVEESHAVRPGSGDDVDDLQLVYRYA